jgi:hypothetical protein
MEEGIIVPRVYVISRAATEGLVQTALAAFSITPLSCVVISDMKDYPMARNFDALILRTSDEDTSLIFARESFEQTNMPSLVIGSSPGISAINEDGTMEALPWPDRSSMLN